MIRFNIILILFFINFAAFANAPKKIILLIGDGMGLSQVSYGMLNNKENSSFEEFKVIGLVKTSSLSGEITDSAAAATAFATGKKTFNNMVGLDQNNKPLKTIIEIAKENNLSTGIIVTSSLTDATPAAFFSHQVSREMHQEIAADFLSSNVDIAIGGGLQYFRDNNFNLIQELEKKKYKIYTDQDLFFKDKIEQKTLALLAEKHMPRMQEGRNNYLGESFRKTINFLNKNKKGFFLLVEGSQIDFAGHKNDAKYLLSEISDFDLVVKEALDFAKKDPSVLVIVTADHETGGFSMIAKNKIDGPSKVDFDLKFISFGHSATMVPLFAFGAGAKNFTGIYDNTEIFNKLKKIIKPNFRTSNPL